MFSRVCQEYLNNFNNFATSKTNTGLAKAVRLKIAEHKNNSTTVWYNLADYIKPAFISDASDRDLLDEMLLIFNHYKYDLVKMLGIKTDPNVVDWINIYASLSSEKIKLIDQWYIDNTEPVD